MTWQKVVFAHELSICDCCGEEPFCDLHQTHYGECDCIGPTEDDVEYKEINGELFGRRKC